jgi:hypothetical protein
MLTGMEATAGLAVADKVSVFRHQRHVTRYIVKRFGPRVDPVLRAAPWGPHGPAPRPQSFRLTNRRTCGGPASTSGDGRHIPDT